MALPTAETHDETQLALDTRVSVDARQMYGAAPEFPFSDRGRGRFPAELPAGVVIAGGAVAVGLAALLLLRKGS